MCRNGQGDTGVVLNDEELIARGCFETFQSLC